MIFMPHQIGYQIGYRFVVLVLMCAPFTSLLGFYSDNFSFVSGYLIQVTKIVENMHLVLFYEESNLRIK